MSITMVLLAVGNKARGGKVCESDQHEIRTDNIKTSGFGFFRFSLKTVVFQHLITNHQTVIPLAIH
jgi:hypothetical protein